MIKGWCGVVVILLNLIVVQETGAQAAPKQLSNALGEDPGLYYVQVVKQWAQATNFAEIAAQVISSKLIFDLKKDPKHQPIPPALKDELEQFFYELFLSPQMMGDLARLYAQYFTLDELQELTQFYKTPLGQKMIQTNAELILKSQQLGANLIKKHEKKYMEIVMKYRWPQHQRENKKLTK